MEVSGQAKQLLLHWSIWLDRLSLGRIVSASGRDDRFLRLQGTSPYTINTLLMLLKLK